MQMLYRDNTCIEQAIEAMAKGEREYVHVVRFVQKADQGSDVVAQDS